MQDDVLVDRGALAAVLEAAGLGELSVLLAPPAEWTPPADRSETLAAAWKELERAGLAGQGTLDAGTGAWLRALVAPGEERYAWVSSAAGPPRLLLAASRGEHGMLAVADGERLRLRRIHPEELDEVLLAELPECTAGQWSIRLALSELTERVDRENPDGEGSDDRVREFRDFAARRPATLCELYAACTPQLGTRRAARRPIWLRDTDAGRFILRCTSSEVSVEPGDQAGLLAALREIRRGLGESQHRRGDDFS